MTNTRQTCHWQTFTNSRQLEEAATEEIVKTAKSAIARNDAFRIVLAGGSTPRRVYERLRISGADWSAWHVYFGDERCLPADDSNRNSRMAGTAWLDHVLIPRNQIHLIPAELGAIAAANSYIQTLCAVDSFDLVLLGLGEDGHTASLFPGRDWGIDADSPDVLSVYDAPKPPRERVSLSAKCLARSSRVIFLVSGSDKMAAVRAWRDGSVIPATAVTPIGSVDVLVDFPLTDI